MFRRAASNYPLNTNSADWNKVLSALDASEKVEENNFFSRHLKYPNTLLLLLLLCVPLICVDYFFVNTRIMPNEKTAKIPAEAVSYKVLHNTANTALKANDERLLSVIKSKTRNNDYPGEVINRKQSDGDDIKFYEREIVRNNDTMTKVFLKPLLKSPNKNEGLAEFKSTSEGKYADKNPPVKLKAGNSINTVLPKPETDFKITSDPIISNENQLKKEATPKTTKNQRLYAGLLAGPDFSTVKFQSVTKTGFSAGLLIGYRLNKKLAAETGVLWDKKFYYTEGKYFNPKNILIPSSIEIGDVTGSCIMIEWPLNLFYTIKSNKKSFLSANAGISSYFMKNENYSYTFQSNGIEDEWHLSYKNSSVNLFSVVNLGIAYNHSVSKSSLLRIQPYIKIPVSSGIGIGRLPISSAGLYVGLTKRIL